MADCPGGIVGGTLSLLPVLSVVLGLLLPPARFFRISMPRLQLGHPLVGAFVLAATYRLGILSKKILYIYTPPNPQQTSWCYITPFLSILFITSPTQCRPPTTSNAPYTPPTCRAAPREWARTSSAACAPGSGAPLAISNTCVSSSATHKTRRAGEYSRLYTPGA